MIPDTGVFRTGAHNVVFIDRGDGYLTPTEVELGPHLDHTFQVLKGLQAGQRIVSSANFLIDSESQLQAASGSFVPPPPGVSAAAGQPQAQGPSVSVDLSTDPNPPAHGKNKLTVTLKQGTNTVRRAGFGDVLYGRDAFDGDGGDEGTIDSNG